jgi:hypothetical protein
LVSEEKVGQPVIGIAGERECGGSGSERAVQGMDVALRNVKNIDDEDVL